MNWGAAPLLGAVTADVLHRPVLSTGVTGDLLTREIKKNKTLITALNRRPLMEPRTHPDRHDESNRVVECAHGADGAT